MDNSVPNVTAPQQAAPINQEPKVLTQQPAGAAMPPASSDNGSSSKMIWVVVGMVVLILGVGGAYLYMNRAPSPRIQTNPPETTQAQGTLEDELNGLNVESEGNDFSEVDKDLQSL